MDNLEITYNAEKSWPEASVTTNECYGCSGTGGFLTCTVDTLKAQVKTSEHQNQLQQSVHGVEKKQLPHLLCVTNMMLHGIEVPKNIRHGNTLNKLLSNLDDADMVDIVVSNPSFGGTEEDGIEKSFPSDMQTRETADLFLQYIVEVLNTYGRAAVVFPDGTLVGEGVKTQRKNRQETPQAWQVSIEDIIARNYNLDIKNPHVGEVISHDPEELLNDYSQQQDIQALRNQLKEILSEALTQK